MIDVQPEDKWFNRPVLDGDERVVASCLANRTQGKRAVGGKLFVTSRLLIFVPNRLDSKMGGEIWESPLCCVQKVGRDEPHFSPVEVFSGALRSRLALTTSQGTREFFVMSGLDNVIMELDEYIRHAEQ